MIYVNGAGSRAELRSVEVRPGTANGDYTPRLLISLTDGSVMVIDYPDALEIARVTERLTQEIARR